MALVVLFILVMVSPAWADGVMTPEAAPLSGSSLPTGGNEGDCLLFVSGFWVPGACPGAGSGAPTDATYLVQTANGTLSAEQALAALSTGCAGITTTTGVVATRTITGTANQITVTNGNCSGNPTLSIPTNPTLPGTTTGTFSGDLTGNVTGDLTNATGLPINTGVSGLAANMAAFLATPSSANLRAVMSDETGSGVLVFAAGALGPASATTPSANDSDTSVATTLWVQNELTDYAADTVSFTNKAYDAEGTGNVLTLPRRIWYPAAGCHNATAASIWDLPTSNPAVAACVTGTNTQKGVLDFADSANLSAQLTHLLPTTWTGTVDARIKWVTSATSGSVVWQLSTICVADAETDDPAFNTASTVTDAAKGTTLQTNDAAITTVTVTGCAAGELLHLKIHRDSAHASDDLAATARLIGVELVVREAL